VNLLEIKEALKYGENNYDISSELFKEGRSPEKWKEVRENSFYKKSLENVIKCGEKYQNTPIYSLPFSKYKIFDTTGSRKEFEDEYFDHRCRLNTFAILSLIYGEAKYIEALEDAIWAICDGYSWCLPAHFGGKTLDIVEKHYPVTTFVKSNSIREHDKIIDLFAAETGFALTEICNLLEDKLAPIVVNRARKLVIERILEPFCELNSMYKWETATNNWAAVCAGSVGVAAIYLVKDSGALAPIILKVLNAMEAFLSGYAEDGACTEGLGYWNYGFGFYIYFTELLRQRTAGKINGFKIPKVKEIASFQQKCYMSKIRTVSFSDGAPGTKVKPGITSLLQEKFSEVELPTSENFACFTDDNCHRWGHDVRNFIWSNPNMKASTEKQASYYLPDAKWLISHATSGETYCAFAAKGGNNNEPHNHNDIGSFIFQLNNEQIFIDIGSGEYTKQYFGHERYIFFCNGSQGHSVPIIDGIYQKEGESYSSVVAERYYSKEKEIFEIDMAKAYPLDNLVSLKRKWEFYKTSNIKLILKDNYIFNSKPETLVERFVSHIEPRLIHPGKVQYNSTEGVVTVIYNPEIMEFGMSEHIYSDHQANKVKAYCLDLKVKDNSANISMEVEFIIGNA